MSLTRVALRVGGEEKKEEVRRGERLGGDRGTAAGICEISDLESVVAAGLKNSL